MVRVFVRPEGTTIPKTCTVRVVLEVQERHRAVNVVFDEGSVDEWFLDTVQEVVELVSELKHLDSECHVKSLHDTPVNGSRVHQVLPRLYPRPRQLLLRREAQAPPEPIRSLVETVETRAFEGVPWVPPPHLEWGLQVEVLSSVDPRVLRLIWLCGRGDSRNE